MTWKLKKDAKKFLTALACIVIVDITACGLSPHQSSYMPVGADNVRAEWSSKNFT